MKYCYAIESGCRFEGGGVDGVSLDYEIAKKRLQKLVKEKQKENDRMDAYEKKIGHYDKEDSRTWKEESKDWWSDGFDYVSIRKLKLL